MKNTADVLLKGLTGRLGGMVFYYHRNRLCARSLPTKVKAPESPGQLAQQARMASIAIFYHALKEAGLYPYWQEAAEGLPQNGYNLLVQANLPAFSGDGRICDFSKLQIVQGKLEPPCGMKLEKGTAGEWVLSWKGELHRRGTRKDDRVRLYLMKDEESFDAEAIETEECCRRDGQCVFRIPEKYEGFPHLYVFFCSRTNGKCSRSRYFLLNQ